MISRQEFGKRLAQETNARVERKRGQKRTRDNVSGNINITKGQLEDKVAVSETAENTALEWQKISRPLLDGGQGKKREPGLNVECEAAEEDVRSQRRRRPHARARKAKLSMLTAQARRKKLPCRMRVQARRGATVGPSGALVI